MKHNLLLLHGALGSMHQFDPFMDILNRDYEVYRFTFDGHGGKPSDQPFSIELFSNNVVEYLDKNNIETINIFGYSMGGYVALHTSLSHPNRIGKIITLGTKFDWTIESAKREVNMLNPIKIKEKVPVFAEKLSREHGMHNWQEVLQKTANMMLDLANEKKLSNQDLTSISHEVVIGIGDEDRMVTIEETKNHARLIPNAKLQILQGVKHEIDRVDVNTLISYIQTSLEN